MKLRRLTPRSGRFSVRFPAGLVPAQWPLSTIGQLTYSGDRIYFSGRMLDGQLKDLLAVNSSKPYQRAIREMYRRTEVGTRWSAADWVRTGNYIDRWHAKRVNSRFFALLRRSDAKGFVILCPTFVQDPLVITVDYQGDLHLESSKSCRFCCFPIERRFHKGVHLSLEVCGRCLGLIFAFVNELDSELNFKLKQKIEARYGAW